VANRRRLVDRDADTLAAALKSLQASRASPRAWYVLEGPSQPDVYLASDAVVIVVEGKRTEAAPATSTDWMSVRHQMLRHLDGAWEHRQGRQIYGLFIVEAEQGTSSAEASSAWQEAVELTVSQHVLNGSLPHRSPEERSQIAGALLGVTTWQAVCDEFQIPREVLIPEVLDDRPAKTIRRKSGRSLQPTPLPDDLDQAQESQMAPSSAPT